MKKIVSIGMMISDILIKPVDSLPKKGTLMPIDAYTLATGGCALNTAVVLAKLQEDASLIGVVGADIFGQFILRDMQEKNVNIDHVVQKQNVSTSCTVVLLDSSGERSFLAYPGGSQSLQYEDLNTQCIFSADIVHIGSTLALPKLDGEPLASLLQQAQSNSCTTLVDTCWSAVADWKKLMMPILPYTDYFIPSYEEARAISGLEDEKEIAAFFADKGARNVIIKLGERGSYVHAQAWSGHVSATPIARAVDTTGAGDAFVGGFICALAHQWSSRACATFAHGVASFIVQAMGANQNAPTREQVLTRILEQEGVNKEDFVFRYA